STAVAAVVSRALAPGVRDLRSVASMIASAASRSSSKSARMRSLRILGIAADGPGSLYNIAELLLCPVCQDRRLVSGRPVERRAVSLWGCRARHHRPGYSARQAARAAFALGGGGGAALGLARSARAALRGGRRGLP